MPFTMPNYPTLTPEQVNPMNAAFKQAFAAYNQGLQAAYAKPNMEQELLKAKLANIWNPKIWESEIGLRGAEADKLRFLVQNPQYIDLAASLISNNRGGGRTGAPQQSSMPMPSNNNAPSGMPSEFGENNRATNEEVNYVAQNGNAALQNGGQGFQNPAHSGAPINLGGGVTGTPVPREGTGYTPEDAEREQGNAQGSPQVNNQAYDPNALAFNPPQMQSPTGNPLGDTAYYKKVGMPPVQQAQLELAQKQAEKYQNESIERNRDFNTQAIAANQSTVDAHKFLNALDRVSSLEIGHFGSKTPAVRDAAQEMETYGNAMAASATQLFKEGKAIHESDIELNKLAKPSRSQNRDVSFDIAHGVIAKNDRLKERQQFYAQGTQKLLKPEILDAMWNKYETERPYMSSDTKMPNDSYRGTWKDYLTPRAVNSFLKGEDYTPPSQAALKGMNWSEKDLGSIKKWARQNGFNTDLFNKKNLYKAADEEGISLAQLKMEFMRRGAFGNG